MTQCGVKLSQQDVNQLVLSGVQSPHLFPSGSKRVNTNATPLFSPQQRLEDFTSTDHKFTALKEHHYSLRVQKD